MPQVSAARRIQPGSGARPEVPSRDVAQASAPHVINKLLYTRDVNYRRSLRAYTPERGEVAGKEEDIQFLITCAAGVAPASRVIRERTAGKKWRARSRFDPPFPQIEKSASAEGAARAAINLCNKRGGERMFIALQG